MFDLLMECEKPLTINSGVIFTKPAGAAENEENTQITHNVFAPGSRARKRDQKARHKVRFENSSPEVER